MKFIGLKTRFKNADIIDIQNIFNYYSHIDRRRLYEWQKKGYIKKIVNNYYIFSDVSIDDTLLKVIANKIYTPSYIGLESALSYYNLIPEAVFNIISISTRKTKKIESDLAYFQYNSINKKLFWGYSLKNNQNRYFFISDLEKTLLDYLYFKPHLSRESDFIALRLNEEELKKRINVQKLKGYLELFSHRRVNTSIQILMEMLHVKF